MRITQVAPALALVARLAGVALADWPSDGLPLATGTPSQGTPVGLTADGGDLFAFWTSGSPDPYALYAQRVTRVGALAPGWPAGGRGIIAAPASVFAPVIAPDGAAGALLGWYGYASPNGTHGIFGVRVDAAGAVVPGWSATGTPICTFQTSDGGGPLNQLMQICSDGGGGAFVAWTDNRNTPPMSTVVYDVFAQHVLANGTLDAAWPADGLALTGGASYKYPHALVPDQVGGFWLVTEDPASNRFRVSRHDGNGAMVASWLSPINASRGAAVSDGASGVFFTWWDCSGCLGTGVVSIRVVRLGPAALPLPGWGAQGVAAVQSTDNIDLPSIIPSENGGVIVSWLTDRPGVNDWYSAQRFEGDGAVTAGWPVNGRIYATGTDGLFGWPLVATDGAGGALFAFRQNLPNVFGSAVAANGEVPAAFPDTGLSLCSVSGHQFPETIVPDRFRGAYVLWSDRRNDPPNGSDVYVTHFTEAGTGTTGVAPPAVGSLALSRPAPNPTSRECAFQLTLPEARRTRVDVLDVSGRIVRPLLDESVAAGQHDVRWDGRDGAGRLAPAGIYVVRVSAGGEIASRRIALLE